MTVPMKLDDGGGSKFVKGRDSTVSMGETDGGDGATLTDTVYLPVEWDGPVVSSRRRHRRVKLKRSQSKPDSLFLVLFFFTFDSGPQPNH